MSSKVVTPCSFVLRYQRFGVSCCLLLQGGEVTAENIGLGYTQGQYVCLLLPSTGHFTMKMEAARSSEMQMITLRPLILLHPEDGQNVKYVSSN